MDGTSTQEPAVVYHYTSVSTLLKILDTKCLWATNIRYLNDHSERQFYIDQLSARIPTFLAAHPEISQDYFERFMTECGETPRFDELPFVTSFSRLADSLPQWRSYCSEGNGVSIGFRTTCLRSAKLMRTPLVRGKWPVLPTISFKEVSYLMPNDTVTLDRVIADAISTSERYLRDFEPVEYEPGHYESAPSIEELIWYALEGAAAITKDAAFTEEREYRLSIRSYIGTGRYLSYRASRATLIPYMEVQISRPNDFLESVRVPPNWKVTPHFINDVVVGPSANQKLTIEALNFMFLSDGSVIPVVPSAIPFRDWL